MFSLGIAFTFRAKLEYFCFMLKSELCPWNFPSLLPSAAAQPQAQVSSRAAWKQSPDWSLSRVLGLSLLCPQSLREEGAGHSFIVFSIKCKSVSCW